jgi:acetyl esterase/lipase
MTSDIARPPYDTELQPVLERLGDSPMNVTRETLSAYRLTTSPTAEAALKGLPDVQHTEYTISGPNNNPLQLSLFSINNRSTNPSEAVSHNASSARRPCIYYLHGGGKVMGSRFYRIGRVLDWAKPSNALVAAIEYRLAPEHPDPAGLEDCYAGLVYLSDNANTLGIDPAKIMITGGSAGGGYAAGIALLARDRNGPKICAQLLGAYMLDDRDCTLSSRQYADESGIWNRGVNSIFFTRASMWRVRSEYLLSTCACKGGTVTRTTTDVLGRRECGGDAR